MLEAASADEALAIFARPGQEALVSILRPRRCCSRWSCNHRERGDHGTSSKSGIGPSRHPGRTLTASLSRQLPQTSRWTMGP